MIEQRRSADQSFRVSVEGEIDIYTAPSLKEKLIPLTERSGRMVTLDLSRTAYIDSTALGVIIAALKSAEKNHCSFSVEGMTAHVKRLFQITGLMELLHRQKMTEGDHK
ncbi:anti-sigma factor antagonist [Sporolactobacillus sp. THM7-7]|nr:anti-sigma factor antagonist [Sporolactobacillus sp. THM7-7]